MILSFVVEVSQDLIVVLLSSVVFSTSASGFTLGIYSESRYWLVSTFEQILEESRLRVCCSNFYYFVHMMWAWIHLRSPFFFLKTTNVYAIYTHSIVAEVLEYSFWRLTTKHALTSGAEASNWIRDWNFMYVRTCMWDRHYKWDFLSHVYNDCNPTWREREYKYKSNSTVKMGFKLEVVIIGVKLSTSLENVT